MVIKTEAILEIFSDNMNILRPHCGEWWSYVTVD